jgi:PEP-CTERM motif
MRKAVFGLIAGGMFAMPVAHAVPVKYGLQYESIGGPSGVGSFRFDAASGTLTDFAWRFGTARGGIADNHFGFNLFGDTRGRYLFEVLSRKDVHHGVDCASQLADCASGDTIRGAGPLGASEVVFYTRGDATTFEFNQGLNTLVSGFVTLSRSASRSAPVPEPGTLGMLAFGMLAVALRRRRAKT